MAQGICQSEQNFSMHAGISQWQGTGSYFAEVCALCFAISRSVPAVRQAGFNEPCFAVERLLTGFMKEWENGGTGWEQTHSILPLTVTCCRCLEVCKKSPNPAGYFFLYCLPAQAICSLEILWGWDYICIFASKLSFLTSLVAVSNNLHVWCLLQTAGISSTAALSVSWKVSSSLKLLSSDISPSHS